MVSHTRRRPPPPPVPGRSSRDRLLAAAAVEFSARGFDGAKVDRIARQAGVNKAMLYYHFGSKAALYQAILLDVFSTIAARVADARREGGTADVQVRRFVRAVAATMAAHPHFPGVWLREMSEGGRHLTSAVVAQLTGVLGTLGAILESGRRDGRFHGAHPLMVQLSIVGPLLLFAVSGDVRARFASRMPRALRALDRHDVVAYVEEAALAALAAVPQARPGRAARPIRTRRLQP
jgi:AcrR family transcriptional regulator